MRASNRLATALTTICVAAGLGGCGNDAEDSVSAADPARGERPTEAQASEPATLEQVLVNPRPSLPAQCEQVASAQEIPAEFSTAGVAKFATADCEGDLDLIALAQVKDAASASAVIDMLVLQEDRPVKRKREDLGGLPTPSLCATLEDGGEEYESCAASTGRFIVFALGDEGSPKMSPEAAARLLASWVINAT